MRRYIIYGAGAVGGALGAELVDAGYEVVLVARGAHKAALETDGLTYVTPEGSQTVRIPVVEHAEEISFTDNDAVVIATKSQDTHGVLAALEPVAPIEIPIICAQNGVANEDFALRVFPNVYGVCVLTPAVHMRPGEVVVHASPHRGTFHLGRYPTGPDEVADEIGEAFSATRFLCFTHIDVRPYKYTKLLNNLINSAQAVLEPSAVEAFTDLARQEGRAAYDAAGITYLDQEEFQSQSGGLTIVDVAGHSRAGGSTWQSLARGASGIESDYLNGEIVLLGRLLGIPTPVNALLQRLSNSAVREGTPPASTTDAEFQALLDKA
jgi:2-dehydropantoate 2-reductase